MQQPAILLADRATHGPPGRCSGCTRRSPSSRGKPWRRTCCPPETVCWLVRPPSVVVVTHRPRLRLEAITPIVSFWKVQLGSPPPTRNGIRKFRSECTSNNMSYHRRCTLGNERYTSSVAWNGLNVSPAQYEYRDRMRCTRPPRGFEDFSAALPVVQHRLSA